MAQYATPSAPAGYEGATSLGVEPQQGLQWVSFVSIWAWNSSLLQYVHLTTDASGNLNVTGGGGGGGSVTQGTVPWVVSGASGVALATEATLAKIPGLAIAIYDACSLAQTSTVDTWTFYTGGLAGTLVNTVTINYTDSTKATIANVVKT
jgi:hypothetical protein